ncbi:hypothetical protein roselon_02849 [Roseibacterium elongatum DSM 19469]|uniref:Phytanoyl-CoA dioxygenase n=1 Tax=Roseicyclus elongatus DSM 19469 TaxID=1294273 RepID=W8S4K7_9RHOB|nr:hypothetical protein roselon_02849 [Roseibacterium elongatum DSM 19469]
MFDPAPSVAAWVAAARPAALRVAQDPQQRSTWLRHGATWFVGVDALPNDARGCVADGPPLRCVALQTAQRVTGVGDLHQAQVSVTYPGYPGRDPGEGDAAHRFRRDRDGAHLDGLLPLGPARRRHLVEPHAYILGLPLTEAAPDAAPLVVWEGSHHLIRSMLIRALRDLRPEAWPQVDLTEVYHATRRAVFETCPRRVIHSPPGGALLLHRMTIHGVAPWQPGAKADPSGRMIAYFRPQFSGFGDYLAVD